MASTDRQRKVEHMRFIGLTTALCALLLAQPVFAQEWQTTLRTARENAGQAFLAALPERLRRTMSELSARCELRTGGMPAGNTVRLVRDV